MTISWILLAVIVVALIFDFTNGFHDAANAIATSIGTRALTPTVALAMAAVLNVFGGLVFKAEVADTVRKFVDAKIATPELVLAALLGAILWNVATWYFGIPSSSSHALIGGLIGAALTASTVTGTLDWSSAVAWKKVMEKAIVPTLASPFIGFLAAMVATSVLYRVVHGGTSLLEKLVTRALAVLLLTAFAGFIFHLAIGLPLEWAMERYDWALEAYYSKWIFLLPGAVIAVWVLGDVIGRGPAEVNGRFRFLQTISAGFMALEHGHNDAQKTMGIITLGLIAGGELPQGAGVPTWVALACSVVIGLGTFSGGKRIIKTMGMKLVKLEPIDGFAAETVAGSVIQVAGNYGMPISTTHAITAAITGVGATKRISAVRWGVTVQILFAWILTLPAAALLAAATYLLLRALA